MIDALTQPAQAPPGHLNLNLVAVGDDGSRGRITVQFDPAAVAVVRQMDAESAALRFGGLVAALLRDNWDKFAE